MSLPVSRRRALALTAAGVLALAACGSDASSDDAEPSPVATDPTLPPATDPPSTDGSTTGGEYDLPTDGSILELGFYGGFTLQEIAFQSAPQLLVTADGQLIESAAVPEIFPGPMLPQHTVSTITDAGVEQLLAFLDESGLLMTADYEADSLIADAATTTLVVTLADGEVRHEAYALGLGGGLEGDADESPVRQRLADAIAQLSDVRSIVDAAEIGPAEPWLPNAFQIVALPAGDLSGIDPEPRILPWPGDTGISLADATECTEVTRDQIGSLLDEADQLTFFTDGETYQLLARPAYPGRSC